MPLQEKSPALNAFDGVFNFAKLAHGHNVYGKLI